MGKIEDEKENSGTKGARLTLTGSAVNFLFRSLSLWYKFDSSRVSSACCFLSSLRWLSEIYGQAYIRGRSLLLFLLLFVIRALA